MHVGPNHKVHPIIFQCYKTLSVFMFGAVILGIRAARGTNDDTKTSEFTRWDLASAAAWIPSGLFTITSVPLCGVSMAMVINASTGCLLSFLVFWLVLGEKVKEHKIGEHEIYFAPLYLAAILCGMCGMVYAPKLKLSTEDRDEENVESGHKQKDQLLGDGDISPGQEKRKVGLGWQFFGVCAAILAGFFSALQYAVMTIGKHYEQDHALNLYNGEIGCRKDWATTCPPKLREQFDNFGSWPLSFGVGAVLNTSVFVIGLAIQERAKGRPLPSFHFNVMKGPGFIAGACWCLGFFFNTAAVMRGGNSIVMAQTLSVALVTSGLWGIFYYKELPWKNAVAWACFALWTLVFMVLLSMEKIS